MPLEPRRRTPLFPPGVATLISQIVFIVIFGGASVFLLGKMCSPKQGTRPTAASLPKPTASVRRAPTPQAKPKPKPKPAPVQKRSFSGEWVATGYTCPGDTITSERIRIHQDRRGNIEAVKITGDSCIRAGEVTFTGVANLRDPNSAFTIHLVTGAPGEPRQIGNYLLTPLSANSFQVTGGWGLYLSFSRAAPTRQGASGRDSDAFRADQEMMRRYLERKQRKR